MVKFGVSSHHSRGTAIVRRAFGNRFLDALPPDDVDGIARVADLQTWTEGTQLARRGDPIDRVYFPISGSIAHVESPVGAPWVEVAAIDRAGISGFEALFDVSAAQFTRLTTRLPLAAVCVDVRPLRRIYENSGASFAGCLDGTRSRRSGWQACARRAAVITCWSIGSRAGSSRCTRPRAAESCA
jgi:hypothetical protein